MTIFLEYAIYYIDSPNGNWSLFRDSIISHRKSERLSYEFFSHKEVAIFSVAVVLVLLTVEVGFTKLANIESVTESGTAADLGAWSAAGSHEGFNRYLPGRLEASLTYLLRLSHFL